MTARDALSKNSHTVDLCEHCARCKDRAWTRLCPVWPSAVDHSARVLCRFAAYPDRAREGFVDCSNGCVGVIESADVEE